MHIMTDEIDKGRILKIKKYKIRKKKPTHFDFKLIGINSIKKLFTEEFENLIFYKKKYNSRFIWGKKIFTRKLFLEKLEIKKKINRNEYLHLLRSFHNDNFQSLYFLKNNKKIYLKSVNDFIKLSK